MERHVDPNANINNKFGLMTSPGDFNNAIFWWYEGGWLYAKSLNGRVLASVRYDDTQPSWLRFRVSTSTVYWEMSASGCDPWTQVASAPLSNIFPMNSVYVLLDAQTFNPPPSTVSSALYSHLNTRGRPTDPACTAACTCDAGQCSVSCL
jgi:hypothetical protein